MRSKLSNRAAMIKESAALTSGCNCKTRPALKASMSLPIGPAVSFPSINLTSCNRQLSDLFEPAVPSRWYQSLRLLWSRSRVQPALFVDACFSGTWTSVCWIIASASVEWWLSIRDHIPDSFSLRVPSSSRLLPSPSTLTLSDSRLSIVQTPASKSPLTRTLVWRS